MTRVSKMLAMSGLALAVAVTGATLQGSSHREAPGITKAPKLDGSDFYMFRSYEAGRSDYVTLLANYIPLQDVYGGPNFFTLDPDGLYEIHIDNNGDAREDVTFQFRFRNAYKNLAIPVGDRTVALPLINVGGVGPAPTDTANLNLLESYTVDIVRGDRLLGTRESVTNAVDGSATFRKPVDRIGDRSILNNNPNAYAQYANSHIYTINIPGCGPGGRLFVGQRREGFVVNLAEVFDLINLNPLGPVNAKENVLADKNVTTLALEVPTNCLVSNGPIIGGWTTSSLGRGAAVGADRAVSDALLNGSITPSPTKSIDAIADVKGAIPPGLFTQVSRLGSPLVNELVIGIKDKDKFNASEPADDAQFADYVTHPTLPALIQALFGVPAPATPRNDLVQVFLTGVPGLNQPVAPKPSEMLRLNTSIPPAAPAQQNPIGVIAGDLAGFPNGRRPGDDVVDIALRAVEGALLVSNPAAFPAVTDGAYVNAVVGYTPEGALTADPAFRLFRDTFPYLQTPLSGSPTPTHQ